MDDCDLYAHYYEAQAMMNRGGEEWKHYNGMMRDEVLKTKSLMEHGMAVLVTEPELSITRRSALSCWKFTTVSCPAPVNIDRRC